MFFFEAFDEFVKKIGTLFGNLRKREGKFLQKKKDF